MANDLNSFTKTTREILAKRANQTCSNPNCNLPTTGPHTDDSQMVDVGEAAHIRGAKPGSKRYDPSMTPAERRHIVNAIWLCRKCAKLIDSDEEKYTVEVLYEWKRNHELKIEARLRGETPEKRISDSNIASFKDESPAAQQIVLDKPLYWEFLLTIELLRPKIKAAKRKFEDIKRGLVYRPKKQIHSEEQLRAWYSKKTDDLQALARLLTGALEELNGAWGEPGTPGDELEIKRAVGIIGHGFDGLLEWELDLQATVFPGKFKALTELMCGWAGNLIGQMDYYPNKLVDLFIDNPPPTEGYFVISTEFKAPHNLGKVTNLILGRGTRITSSEGIIPGCLKFVILAIIYLILFSVLFGFFVSGLGLYGIPLSVIASTLAYYSPNYRNWLSTQPGYIRYLSKLPGLQSNSPTALTISTLSYLLPISFFSILLINDSFSQIGTAFTTAAMGLIGIVALYGWLIKGWFLSSRPTTPTKFPLRVIVSDIKTNRHAVGLMSFASSLPILCCGGVFAFAVVNEPLREAGLLATYTPTPSPTYTPTSTPTLVKKSTPTGILKPTAALAPTATNTPVVPPTDTPTAVVISIDAPDTPASVEVALPAGDSMTVDNWEIRVERIEFADSLTGISGKTEKAAGRFALVFLAVTNKGLSPNTFGAFGTVDIQDGEGRSYEENFLASAYAQYLYKTDIGAEINPDATAHVVSVFDIPKRSDNYTLAPGSLAQQSTGIIPLNIP